MAPRTPTSKPAAPPDDDAVLAVVAAAPPDWYGVNCAHPLHVAPALDESADAPWRARIAAFRPNASILSHGELDEATELDLGDLTLLVRLTDQVRAHLPSLQVVGGCCGTDASRVSALWGSSGS